MNPRQLTVEDVLEVVRKRWPVLVLLAIVGAGAGWEVARILPKRYKSQTVVLVEQPTVPGDYVKPVVIEDVNQRLASMQQEILSRSRLEPIIKQLEPYPEDANRASMDDLVGRLQKAITVTPIQPMAQTGGSLPGFTVSVTFDDPRMAQQIASTITEMFTAGNVRARQQTAEETSDFLASQLEQAKLKLDEQDKKLADFQRRYMGALPDEAQTNVNMLTGLASQLDAATQALSRAQQDKSFTESTLAQELASWQATQTGLGGPNPDALETQLSALQNQLVMLRSKYTDNYPDVVKLKADIVELQQRIASSAQNQHVVAVEPAPPTPAEPAQIQNLRAQIHQQEIEIQQRAAQQDELQKQIKLYQSRVESSPAVQQDYKALTRDYQTALDFYNDLLKKRDQSAMATDLERRQEGEQFQVLDAANLPTAPSFPNLPLFVLGGAAAGLGSAFGLFLLLELLDTSLRNDKEVETLLHLPVLAIVPTIKGSTSNAKSPLSVGAHS